RDAADDAVEQPAAAGLVERPDSERIHERDRPGAHAEDVAEDAPGAGGRTLIRLDGARVVVALDADRRRDAVTDVEHAGAFARPDQDGLTLGRQPLEVQPRRLV